MNTWRILGGDVRTALRDVPAGSVQCCVTSPPYWGLRDYGTAQWEGGDAGCDHKGKVVQSTPKARGGRFGDGDGAGRQETGGDEITVTRGDCIKCGATRIDQQIGQEPTPEAYVQTMVEVFREVRRVLHDSGTVWLNVGDSYARGAVDNRADNSTGAGGPIPRSEKRTAPTPPGLKPKDLCLIPWRLAIALQADGWWVRSVICWAKKSCMPESVTDRPTNSWEPIFLLSKRASYFYDAEAVKEPAQDWSTGGPGTGIKETHHYSPTNGGNAGLKGIAAKYKSGTMPSTRNQRNVWPLPGAFYRLRADISAEQKEKLVADLLRRGVI